MGTSRRRPPEAMDSRADELQARLAAIVDSSDDAIVSKTLDGVITSWNGGAQRIFGYSPDEAVGQHIFLIIPDDRRAEEEQVLARLRRGDKIDHFETVRRAKDGRLIPVSLTVSPVRDSTGRIIGASKVARDVTERVRAEEALRRAHDELEARVGERTAALSQANAALRHEIEQRRRAETERSQLFTRLLLAQEEERRRIARELHDQLGQQMTALRLTLETLKTIAIDRPDVARQVESLQELARQLDQDIAFRVWELTPSLLEKFGLAAALTEYAGNWSRRAGVRTDVSVTPPKGTILSPDMETTLYRFAQEALNNIAKHARASHVDIVLEQIADQVSLSIRDNGVGFNPGELTETGGGFGLIGMRERAALAGAAFAIQSAPGAGTTVRMQVPMVALVLEGG